MQLDSCAYEVYRYALENSYIKLTEKQIVKALEKRGVCFVGHSDKWNHTFTELDLIED
jgi:hypothetical protein